MSAHVPNTILDLEVTISHIHWHLELGSYGFILPYECSNNIMRVYMKGWVGGTLAISCIDYVFFFI